MDEVWRRRFGRRALLRNGAALRVGALLRIGGESHGSGGSPALSTAGHADRLALAPGSPAAGPDLIETVVPDVPKPRGAATRLMEGYAGADSVNVGASINLHVRSALPRYDVHVWRMGWYGGAGGQRVASFVGLDGATRAVPTPDPVTSLIAAAWPVSLVLQVGTNWRSGAYMAALHEPGATAPASYIPFVVRNDASTAPIVHQLATATWQAYNNWGGKSLYDYNSTQGRRAQQVSFDRPYAAEFGAGTFFTGGDYNLIQFYEREGYDVTYITSVDTELLPAALTTSRQVFTTAWHDEYWSTRMRTNLEAALGRGMHGLFFSSNNIYWRTRLLPAPDGRPARVMVCAKDTAVDPETVLFRDPAVGKPENELLGGMYNDYFAYGSSAPWVVANADHWIYADTGLRDGDAIPRLVGYEWDRTFGNGRSPAGLVPLSRSPVIGLTSGTSVHEATIHTRSSGAVVFNAATNYWAWLLSNTEWGVDERVRTITRNLLRRTTRVELLPARYRAVQPIRVLDTRSGRAVPGGEVQLADIARVADLPTSGVAAVVCNLTVTDTSAATYVLAYPSGTVRPDPASSVNAPAGATVANLVIVPPGADNKIALFNAFGDAHMIVDVVGWLPVASVDGYTAVPATRVLDTRPNASLGAGETRRIPMAGRAGIPAGGAGSVVVNVTATDATQSTYLLAAPSGATHSGPASTVNTAARATVANLAVVGLGTDGAIAVSNAFGNVHVVVDVVGWAPAAAITAIDPVRILDTRWGQPLGPNENRPLVVVGRAGVPATATGVIMNLTLTDPTDGTWVLAFPSGAPQPLASSVNASARATVANLAVVAPGAGGAIDLYNAFGRAHLIVDVVGWLL